MGAFRIGPTIYVALGIRQKHFPWSVLSFPMWNIVGFWQNFSIIPLFLSFAKVSSFYFRTYGITRRAISLQFFPMGLLFSGVIQRVVQIIRLEISRGNG